MLKECKNKEPIHITENTMEWLSTKLSFFQAALSETNDSLEKSLKSIESKFASRKEICRILNITEPTLIRRRNAGKIHFIKLGNSFYYLKPEAAVCCK